MNYMSLSSIDPLQRPPRVLAILPHLLDHEETTPSDSMKDLNVANKTYCAATMRLIELDLVYEHEEKTFPRRVFTGLTPEGGEVSECLRPISDVLENALMGLVSEIETLEGKVSPEEECVRILLARLGGRQELKG